MVVEEDIKPVSYLRTHADDVLRLIGETGRSVTITKNGVAKAVVQDPASYDKMHRAVALLKLLAQGESDVASGRTTSQESVMREARKRLHETVKVQSPLE